MPQSVYFQSPGHITGTGASHVTNTNQHDVFTTRIAADVQRAHTVPLMQLSSGTATDAFLEYAMRD